MSNANENRTETLTPHILRCSFEHKLLPAWLYKDADLLVPYLLDSEDVLFGIFDGLYAYCEVPNPYTADQFEVFPIPEEKDILGFLVVMPEPKEAPECYLCLLLFNSKRTKLAYFTFEKMVDNEKMVFCSWEPNGMHIVYDVVDAKDDWLSYCFEIFKKRPENDTYDMDIEIDQILQ